MNVYDKCQYRKYKSKRSRRNKMKLLIKCCKYGLLILFILIAATIYTTSCDEKKYIHISKKTRKLLERPAEILICGIIDEYIPDIFNSLVPVATRTLKIIVSFVLMGILLVIRFNAWKRHGKKLNLENDKLSHESRMKADLGPIGMHMLRQMDPMNISQSFIDETGSRSRSMLQVPANRPLAIGFDDYEIVDFSENSKSQASYRNLPESSLFLGPSSQQVMIGNKNYLMLPVRNNVSPIRESFSAPIGSPNKSARPENLLWRNRFNEYHGSRKSLRSSPDERRSFRHYSGPQ